MACLRRDQSNASVKDSPPFPKGINVLVKHGGGTCCYDLKEYLKCRKKFPTLPPFISFFHLILFCLVLELETEKYIKKSS